MGYPYPTRRPGGRSRLRTAALVASVLIVVVTGAAWWVGNSVHRSWILGGARSGTTGNFLIMGLDSRLDEDGNPLPSDIYNALHAGDAADGGQNANVLMLMHIPDDGGRATSVSIPRDDFVDLPGCPDNVCKAKIKQAYGLAFAATQGQLANQSGLSNEEKVQRARDAGRKEEIDTVRQFLGGIGIDHFVEVTLVAFLQMARVVAPITVCLNENTRDSYSGANFHSGMQQISAAQAVAFVRQRRDNSGSGINFSDLDRERRQQAFIVSLAHQLQQAGTLANPAKLMGIMDVAKKNIAVDSGLNVLGFARQAADLSGDMTFVTLPIDHFGTSSDGEDVNIVDPSVAQEFVHKLFDGADRAGSSDHSSATVDVVNANGEDGLAGRVSQGLEGHGYQRGSTGNADEHEYHSMIYYGSDSSTTASAISPLLGGLPTRLDSTLSKGHLRVVLGDDFIMPSALAHDISSAADSEKAPDVGSTPVTSGSGIPCVK